MGDFYNKIINQVETSKNELKKRVLKNGSETIAFIFVNQLTDKKMLANEIIKPIAVYLSNHVERFLTTQEIVDYILFGCDFSIDDKEEKLFEYVLRGMSIVLLSDDKRYIVVNTKDFAKRAVDMPELGLTMRGPRDSFNENMDTNLSLLRYRIKDPNLVIDPLEVGRRTKTRVSVIHIEDIANDAAVQEITKRIAEIDVDGIVDSGELQKLIKIKGFNLFPRMGITERSDMAAAALLEGKIVVMVEGSPIVLMAPKIFSEFFFTCDDNYDNKFLAVFGKYIRMTAAILSISITALYIAVLSYHIDTLPADFILIIHEAGQGQPFNVFIGAFVAEMIVELIREAMLRVSKQIGPAAGIVGGIVIGQAAIAAKIFSPLLLIVSAVSLLSSFTAPDYTIANPLRIMKFFFMGLSACFGLIGFSFGICIMTINLVSISTFGTPYFAGFAPFNWYDFKHTFIYSKYMAPKRPNFMKTKDKIRSDDSEK